MGQPKRRKRSLVVKDLDRVFSLFKRIEAADKNEMVECFTCGRPYHYKKIQNGHFQSRRHYATRWHELNTAPQCYGCNVGKQGEQYKFAKKLDEVYGAGTAQHMEICAQDIVKIDTSSLEEDILYYTQKVYILCKMKGIEYPSNLKKPK